MYLIRVIPISRGIDKDSLTYFSLRDCPVGHIASIQIRSRMAPAIVYSSEKVEMEKSSIKQLPYELKKISDAGSGSQPFFNQAFMKAVENIATHHASSAGAVIEALTPSNVLSEHVSIISKVAEIPVDNHPTENLMFQADDETRLAHYKSIIREEFAKKNSVFILVPTVHEANFIKEGLEKGIESYTYVAHGGLSKKASVHLWNEVISNSHPVLVIGTAIFLSIPRRWNTIIVERESSRHYKMSQRPFLDVRRVAEKLALHSKATCIFADVMLRAETLCRYEDGEIHEVSKPQWRSMSNSKINLVDLRSLKFSILSNELRQLISDNKSNGRRLFIYVSRRGNSPQIICRDCGNTVMCNRCSAPVVLHTSAAKSDRYFLCHSCGERRTADESCTHCESWHLQGYGVGIESAQELLSKEFPNIKIFRIDSDTTPTDKKATAVIDEFYTNPGSILLGTDRALYYLKEPIENVAIASLDSLFSLPDFRIQEKIFHTILQLRSLSSHTFIAQTRYTDNPLWNYALKGNLIDFYRSEKDSRKQFHYPPYKTLIKITYTGTPALVRKEMSNLKSILEPYVVNIFPAFIENKKGKFVMHGLLRLDKRDWPNLDLHDKLRSLPPSFAVNVDPENLL